MQQELLLSKHVGRTPCCSKIGLNRGPWTPDEDLLLTKYIQAFGEGRWRTLPKKAGLHRCGKSCRLRWMNYLRPDVKRGCISPDEEDLILRLHRLLGNRWSLIAGRIPGRTDNEIKNYWNTHLSKQLISQGIDPRTHKPLSQTIENPYTNTNTPESSCDKPDLSIVKRNSDSIEICNGNGNHNSDHQVSARKKHKVEYMNAMESLRSSVTTAAGVNFNEQAADMIDWKYHVKAADHHHVFPLVDMPCMEALEPGLVTYSCSPYNFINNIPAAATTYNDIHSISHLCSSDHCNPISHSTAPAPNSINTIQFNEYEGNMLFDRRFHVPKAEVFADPNGSVNSTHQVYLAPNSNQDSYGPYLESIVHDQDYNLTAPASTSQSLQLRLELENPNSACDLWSLYQYHPYT